MEDESRSAEDGDGDGAESSGRTGAGGRSGSREADGGGRPAWLQLPQQLPSDEREVAEKLARLVDSTPAGELPSPEVEALADEHSPADLAGMLGHLHVCLDRLPDGETPDGVAVEELRSRLVRLTEELWTQSLDAELQAYHTVLRDISHDIRSPLNSILFLVDGLYGGQSGSLTDVQRQQIGVVYSAAASLLTLVNDLLDFARIAQDETDEQVVTHRVPFSVEGVLADVRRLVSPIAEHKDCDLRTEVEVSGPRRGDPQVLSRVLVNLVSNAISAAGEEGEVLVRIQGDSEGLRTDVVDDGDDPDLERIREAVFPRSDAEMKLTRVLSGQTQGLGLVICGRMVRQVGGKIDVHRTDDGRTCFTVEVPFAEG